MRASFGWVDTADATSTPRKSRLGGQVSSPLNRSRSQLYFDLKNFSPDDSPKTSS